MKKKAYDTLIVITTYLTNYSYSTVYHCHLTLLYMCKLHSRCHQIHSLWHQSYLCDRAVLMLLAKACQQKL